MMTKATDSYLKQGRGLGGIAFIKGYLAVPGELFYHHITPLLLPLKIHSDRHLLLL